jgi:alpha-1,2-mannosyltransferase
MAAIDTVARHGHRHGTAIHRQEARSPKWVILGVMSAAAAIVLTLSSVGPHQLDFEVYRTGGLDAFSSHLYTTRVTSRHLFFTYPPFAALLFWPIGHLSVRAGQIGWGLLNCVALFALIGTSMKVARGVGGTRLLWSAACIVLLPAILLNPVRLSVILGEVNIFIVLMVLADLTLVIGRRTHTLPRGVLLGVAAAIKLTPLVFVPFLFLSRQFKAGFTALATFLVCTLGGLVLLPHSSWLYWTKEVLDSKRVGSSWFVDNQNLRGALERLTGTTPRPILLLSLTLVAAIGGLVIAAWAYRSSSPLLGILLCAATGLIISPISWADHYVWIVPALAWLILGTDRPNGGRWWAAAAAIVFVLAPMFWLPHYLHHYSGPVEYVQGNIFFLSVVSFVALTAIMLWRRTTSGVQPTRAVTERSEAPA